MDIKQATNNNLSLSLSLSLSLMKLLRRKQLEKHVLCSMNTDTDRLILQRDRAAISFEGGGVK